MYDVKPMKSSIFEIIDWVIFVNINLKYRYTTWGADVSEKGFSYNNGVAVVPDANLAEMNNSEKLKWSELTEKERQAQLYKFDKPGFEKTITQEMRQAAFDNYETTDDHAHSHK